MLLRYCFRSPVGSFLISPRADGRWSLSINNQGLGTYRSAMQAADDVSTHATGHFDWDVLDGRVSAPTDLSEWMQVKGP